MPEVVWEGVTPGGAWALRLIFAPTRTVLGEPVSVLPAAIAGLVVSSQLGPPADGLVVDLEFGEPPAAGADVKVGISYTGECPQPYVVEWRSSQSSLFARTPTDEYHRLYQDRARLAAQDADQAFFFDLDRHTMRELLQHNPDVCEDVAVARVRALECLHPLLAGRLSHRFRNSTEPQKFDRPDLIRPFSEIFWSAARSFLRRAGASEAGRGGALLGDLLERFAAGLLKRRVDGREGSVSSVIVGEPDSFFVFFFAEFASAAIQHEDDEAGNWERILDATIRMQRLFAERYLPSKLDHGSERRGPYPRLTDYNRPPPRCLARCETEALQRQLASRTRKLETRDTLKLLADRMGRIPRAPVRCTQDERDGRLHP